MDLKQLEKISKALGDESRLKILQNMSKRDGQMQCAEIVTILNLAQPSVSHHVKTLIEAGIIEAEKEGRTHNYILNKQLLATYVENLALLSK